MCIWASFAATRCTKVNPNSRTPNRKSSSTAAVSHFPPKAKCSKVRLLTPLQPTTKATITFMISLSLPSATAKIGGTWRGPSIKVLGNTDLSTQNSHTESIRVVFSMRTPKCFKCPRLWSSLRVGLRALWVRTPMGINPKFCSKIPRLPEAFKI